MPKVHFLPAKKEVFVSEGTQLKDICEEFESGVTIGCGMAACGSCKIKIRNAKAVTPMTVREEEFLEKEEVTEGIRLACQCAILADTIIDTLA